MMKRNDGYALSYVMVILLVLCAIALSVTTISLHNLKRQQASIERMQDKYEAQGVVEQVVAQLENAAVINEELLTQIENAYKEPDAPTSPLELDEGSYNNGVILLGLQYAHKGLHCTVNIDATLSVTEPPAGSPSKRAVTYTSYSTKIVEVPE